MVLSTLRVDCLMSHGKGSKGVVFLTLRVHCFMSHESGRREDGILNVKSSLSYEPCKGEGGGGGIVNIKSSLFSEPWNGEEG